MQTLSPIHSQQRVWIMDALRGLAILGIFIMNLRGFTLYSERAANTGQFFTSFDDEMSFIHKMFFEGKFYSIFSFLFGWGIALQLAATELKGISPARFVSRRLFIMFILGMIHMVVFWSGDIVTLYALVGFLLLSVRKWSDRSLFITAIILLLSPILLYYLKMKFPMLNTPSIWLRDTGIKLDGKWNNVKSDADFFTLIHNGNLIDYIKLNATGFFFRFSDLFFQSRISKVLGFFILGYLMGRNGRYKAIMANNKLLMQVAIAGLIIGVPLNYFLAKLMESGEYYKLSIKGLYQTIWYAFGVAPLAIAYIAIFLLLANTSFTKILQVLRPVGKMAFTNYMLHSLIGMIFFSGVGLGMDQQVGPVYYTVFAIIVFIFQIILSTVWFKYFEYGPVEWLWRTGTYRKRQPFIKQR